MHLRDRLAPELAAAFRAILVRRRSVSAKVDRAIRATGGIDACSRDLAADLLTALYTSAFKPESASELAVTAGTPYIASLCSHRSEDYERENGLLSQWRGYGGESGFCLVFDTKGLADMLGAEFDTFGYTHLNMGEAHYASPDKSMAALFPSLFDCCEKILLSLLKGEAVVSDAIKEFFPASTLVKHQAFREEREVRIVGIPITEPMRQLITKENPGVGVRASRPEVSPEPPNPKRYIELFKGSCATLPIKRLIVGPSSVQATKVEMAKRLSAGRFEVIPSGTPYKG